MLTVDEIKKILSLFLENLENPAFVKYLIDSDLIEITELFCEGITEELIFYNPKEGKKNGDQDNCTTN